MHGQQNIKKLSNMLLTLTSKWHISSWTYTSLHLHSSANLWSQPL